MMAVSAGTITPENGGAVNVDAATSVTRTHEDSPDLLLDTIDKEVTKIRPHEVVLDTISRHAAKTEDTKNQVVKYYSIDVIELSTTVNTAIAGGANLQEELNTADNRIFARDQTIFVNGVPGYKEDGVTVDPDDELMLYVVGRSANGRPNVVAVNGPIVGGIMVVPAIPVGTQVTRAGRAGSESQIQTDAYSGIPTPSTQYMQKFMAQIEQTTFFKMADKEVNWTFSDQEEEAIFDMKRTENLSFWYGKKRMIIIQNARANKPEETYFTGGIWNMAGKEYNFGGLPVDENNIVGLMKSAFVGNASSKKKIFIVGSDLLEKFEQIDYKKVVYVGTRQQAYGLEFSSIISKFGTLLVIHDQTLNDLGWSDRGFILDADYLKKWSMGWMIKNFDFRSSGQSDSDGRALIEPCGLTLKNPEAHMRVLFN
ncbi:MAG: hypothetical protein LBV72_00585 [Tannerella sp.]|nr:hypothetical protein [Tannerella sp.]